VESAVVVFSAIIAVASLAVALIVAGHVLRRRGKAAASRQRWYRAADCHGCCLVSPQRWSLRCFVFRCSSRCQWQAWGLFFLIKDGRRGATSHRVGKTPRGECDNGDHQRVASGAPSSSSSRCFRGMPQRKPANPAPSGQRGGTARRAQPGW
jgi:hypothetical protein